MDREGGESRDGRGFAWLTVVTVVAAVLAGALLRAWILARPIGRADADESVVALMARGILHGQHPVFFWGQAYGGSLEAALVAVAFRVAGTSTVALKLVPVGLCAVAALGVRSVAARVMPRPAATFAGALFLVYPPAFVWWSTKERGFYWVSLVCVVAGLYLVVRLLQALDRDESPARVTPFLPALLGVVLGLGWWTSPQTMFVLAPAVGYLVVRAGRRSLRWWSALPGAVLGAAPWIAWNTSHSLRSLRQLDAAVPTTYGTRLRLFFTRLLPSALGLRRPFTGEWLGTAAVGAVLYVLVLAAFVLAAVAIVRRGSVFTVFVVVVAAYPFLFAAPSTSYYVDEPRYALMLAPVIVVLVAAATRQRGPLVQAAAMALAIVLAANTVAFTQHVADTHPYSVDLVPPRFGPLVHVLDRVDVDRVYADYWIAYPLTLATKERIAASPVDAVRSAALRDRVAAASRSTFVLFRGRPRDTAFGAALRRRHVGFRHLTTDRFSIYVTDRRLDPASFTAVWRLPSP